MITVILLAAGSSQRMGEDKLLMPLCGTDALHLSYNAACRSYAENIVIATSQSVMAGIEKLKPFPKPTTVVLGGETRAQSVCNALLQCSGSSIVAIHDAARCLITPEIINTSIEETKKYGSAIAVVPVRDTVRNVESNEIYDRNKLLLMQTPQTFIYSDILKAYEGAQLLSSVTDDCSLYIAAGFTPHYFNANIINQKLTYKDDVDFFKAIINERKAENLNDIRVGYGEDTHRLCEGRRLVLGGVEIPFRLGLLGHSDADVLCHAVTDAVLGACALGDIGKLFPDSNSEYKDANSVILLKQAVAKVKEAGFYISNIDVTVIAQEPKLASHTSKMCENLAYATGCDAGRISVKATTPEHTGPEGNLECITARAVALCTRIQ